MRRLTLVLLAGFLAVTGCAGDKGKELFETAQFEEKQHNNEHALKLYREIIRKFPGSEYARRAQERLDAVSPGR